MFFVCPKAAKWWPGYFEANLRNLLGPMGIQVYVNNSAQGGTQTQWADKNMMQLLGKRPRLILW
jgi:hypothetical protein